MPHTHIFRIYYEDTDAGGVVYYANYLKFAERARTELLRAHGIEQQKLLEEQGLAFIVRHAELDLKSPARLDDEITIHTEVQHIKPASVVMHQSIRHRENSEDELAVILVKIACVNREFKPTPMPKDLLAIFEKTV